jgi:hypothetical protein
LVLALALAASLAGAVEARTTCKDDNGKRIACPVHKASHPAARCRDKTTRKFAKCSAPNTEPLPVKKKTDAS